MDMTGISTFIGSVGFPIAAFLLLYVRMEKADERHADEMNGMRSALEGNTLAITKLCDRMDGLSEVNENG